MGTWGTGISSNDVYEDINYQFFDLYNQGTHVAEITEKLIKDHKDLIESPKDKNNFWITIAKAQWECKALDSKVLNRVQTIIESESDIKIWKELGANQSDLKKRRKVLNTFLLKIQTPKKTAKKRVKKKFRDSIFEKGDCLVFKLSNGDYCGAFVLESEKGTEFGLNLIVTTNIKLTNKPTIEAFENASAHFSMEEKITFKNNELSSRYAPVPQIHWYHSQFYKKADTEFEVIGQLKVSKTFDSSKDYQRFSNWDNMPLYLDSYYSNLEKNKCKGNLTLKKLRKNSWF